MQHIRVEIATYAGLLHATVCFILNSLLHAVKLLCFEISIPFELQMTSDPLFSTVKRQPNFRYPFSPQPQLQAMALLLRTVVSKIRIQPNQPKTTQTSQKPPKPPKN